MVCLAPLTNLALTLKVSPSVATDLKEVVLMGGNIEGVGNMSIAAEFNFHADPEAAFVVLDAARCPVVMVSWELCFKYIHIPMVSERSCIVKQVMHRYMYTHIEMEERGSWENRD